MWMLLELEVSIVWDLVVGFLGYDQILIRVFSIFNSFLVIAAKQNPPTQSSLIILKNIEYSETEVSLTF